MGRGRGAGRSNYSGLRLSLLQTPGSDMAQVLIKAKAPADGWDEYGHLVTKEQIFVGPITNTDSALTVARDFLDALLNERALNERWEAGD